MRAFFVLGHHPEIDDVERFACRIETRGHGPLETAAAGFRARAFLRRAIDGKLGDHASSRIDALHFAADGPENLPGGRGLVSENCNERLANEAEPVRAREI